MNADRSEITSLLAAVTDGDVPAAERLWRMVYDELRRIAKARMGREKCRRDLQTTVLVQEAYLRLIGRGGASVPATRRGFFAAAANAMRQYLVDDARKRGALKRGGATPRRGARAAVRNHGRLVAVPAEPVGLADDPAAVLAVDETLTRLRDRDPRKAEIVQLRYFAGLTIDETAEVLGLSPRTVDKEWRFARAWLHRELA